MTLNNYTCIKHHAWSLPQLFIVMNLLVPLQWAGLHRLSADRTLEVEQAEGENVNKDIV